MKKGRLQKQNISVLLIMAVMIILGSLTVFAGDAPVGPTELSTLSTTRFDSNNYPPQEINVLAGNITKVYIDGISQTRAWAGLYGNVTGTITLDDANNFTFYNWTAAEPQGQVYATLSNTVAWDSVVCMNFTSTTDVNESVFENYYGIETDDVDGVKETFNWTNHPQFTVASQTIGDDEHCPTTYIYQNDQAQSTNFVNVLLADPTNDVNGWIFTSIIENKDPGNTADKVCYNGEYCDFQILIAENGHDDDVSTTLYYIWVELI